jgi:hypothetical protein
MEVGLKQFVYCPSFSLTCLCSFVVLYGGGVAAATQGALRRRLCGGSRSSSTHADAERYSI